MKKIVVLLITLLFAHAVEAKPLGGITVPERTNLNGESIPLSGAAIRSKFIFDVYVAAFYARDKIHSPAEALQNKGPKRMWFHFLRNVSKKQIEEAWEEGIRSNNSPQIVSQHQADIQTFINSFEDMNKGGLMMVDYIPGKGTEVTINGTVKAVIPGDSFYSVALSTWMGSHPPSSHFQSALIGR